MIEIEFYKIPLSVDFEKLKPKLLYDPRLIKAISDYADELALKDVETWVYEGNLIVTESGYFVAVFKEEKNLIGDRDKYVDMCEKTVDHFISTIQRHRLYEYFDKNVINDAMLIKNMIRNKTNDEKAS